MSEITGRQIQDGSVGFVDLSEDVQNMLRRTCPPVPTCSDTNLHGVAHQNVTSISARAQVGFSCIIDGASEHDCIVATPPNALHPAISIFSRCVVANMITIFLSNMSDSRVLLELGTWNIVVIKTPDRSHECQP